MKNLIRTLALALTVALACSGCMVVAHDNGHAASSPSTAGTKKTVYVCSVCGKRKATASASGQAPSCHGRKMSPAQ